MKPSLRQSRAGFRIHFSLRAIDRLILGDRNFRVVVPEDVCATLGVNRHEAALETFAYGLGAFVQLSQ
jgi:nicotinamidase-related amidase